MRPFKAVSSIALAAGLASISSAAIAAGTQPGTIISNSVDITYTTGGSTITRENEDTVSFVVDQKVDFTLEGEDASSVVIVSLGAVNQQQTYRLFNEGNAASGFDIDVANSGDIGLTHDATGSGAAGTYSVYIGTSAGQVSGDDTLYDPSGTVPVGDIDPDAELFVKVLAHMPLGISDSDTESFTVTATALIAGSTTIATETASPSLATVDIFLADDGFDGIESDSEDYSVSAPKLIAGKFSALISENTSGTFDCANGASDPAANVFVPGACVQYTLSITNEATASVSASDLTVTDVLPDEVTFVGLRSNAGFDSYSETDGTITASVTSLAPGETAELTFRVTID